MALFNENQRKVLVAICDSIWQSHSGAVAQEILAAVPKDAPQYQRERVEAMIGRKYSDLPGAIEELEEQYKNSLSKANNDQIALTLSLLSTRAGTLVLTGHVTPFPELSVEQREQVLLSWSTSRIPLLRSAYRGFVCIVLFVVYTAFEENALATGYPAGGDPTLTTERRKTHHPYVFEHIEADFDTIETDVLVIGSGAGGGVVSSFLAEKGWKMLVVEKGQYVKPEEMEGSPKEGFRKMYEQKGLIATEDGGLNILAGSTFGGGTTVNWSASLAPQHFIRECWGKEHGLRHFLTRDFGQSIDAVAQRMGVSVEAIEHSKPNKMLIDASTKLGYHVGPIPQNTARSAHRCGFCSFGCPTCEKQGGTVTWLKDAAAAGAHFMVDTNVERLLFAPSKDSPAPTRATIEQFYPSASRRQCVGALVRDKNGKYAIIRAREAVVVSAGSLNSPAILLKSRLKNPRIGKNLRLHPATFTTGFYDEKIDPWEGSIMTAVSTVRENRDGSHHGCKIEVNMSFPGGSAASFVPWRGSEDHKKKMVQFNHAYTLLSICRDRGSGQIVLDADEHMRIEYVLDPYDGESLVAGVIACAEIHLLSGANRITTAQAGVEDYVPAPGHQYLTDPKWLEWVEAVTRMGIHPGKAGIASAHQMGSCQMGVKPSTSTVDPRGRVWGTESLYVADASVMPTASGVNPALTTMAVSYSIAKFIDEDLRLAATKPIQAHL